MEKWYSVWREDEDRGNAWHVKAPYASLAAERWAEHADSWSADYTIVCGENARVFVALETEGSTPTLFEVSGEQRAIYNAREAV
jgi:hypothetical protein